MPTLTAVEPIAILPMDLGVNVVGNELNRAVAKSHIAASGMGAAKSLLFFGAGRILQRPTLFGFVWREIG